MPDTEYQGRTERQQEQMFQIGNVVGLSFFGILALAALYGLASFFV